MKRLAIVASVVASAAQLFGVQSVKTPQELRTALRDGARAAGGVIELVGDDWRFGTNDVTELKFFISNHDQQPLRPVNLPIVGCTNLTLRGHGQTLRFDGRTVAALVHRSENVRIENLRFDWTSPALADGVIEAIKDGRTIVRLDPEAFPYRLVAGGDGNCRLVRDYAGGSVQAWPWMLFSGKTHEVIERTADVTAFWSAKMKALPDNRFSIGLDCSKIGAGAGVGDIVCIRPGGRLYPAVLVDHAKDVTLEDLVLYTASGMGLIAQLSENVTWRGTRPASEKVSGTFPPAGTARVTTLHADATHFSNVRGKVVVENCWFETMMDDALNVHATSLSVVEKPAPNVIRCRYMNDGAYGFNVFDAGDTVRFIAGRTLENGAEIKLTSVAQLNDRELVLTLAEPVPAAYGVGDAVENATCQPSVVFRGNVVRNNRARGILLTTSGPCVVEDNLFDRVSGSAILFAGDAQGWYESGSCTDVTVRRNVFRNCLTSRFQFCEAIVVSCPMIRDLAAQKVPYHRDIRITDNVFETFDVPLVYALSTKDIVWQRNRVKRNADYQGWNQPAFRLEKSNFSVNDQSGL